MWPFKKKYNPIPGMQNSIELIEMHCSGLQKKIEDLEKRVNEFKSRTKSVQENTDNRLDDIAKMQIVKEREIKDFFGILEYQKTQENPQVLKDGGLLFDMLMRIKESHYMLKKIVK